MNRKLLFFVLGLIATKATAADSLSLKQQAIQETAAPASASQDRAWEAAQSSSMLRLKDPRVEALGRSWNYFLDLSVSRFQPQGTADSATQTNFNLGQSPTSNMFGLGIGVDIPAAETRNFQFHWGLDGQARYSLQNQTVTLPSGFQISDAKLSTILATAQAYFGVNPLGVPSLDFEIGPEIGNLNYTQTSSNDFANFSKHAAVTGWDFAVLWKVGPQWSASLRERFIRVSSNDATISIPSAQTELGAQLKW